MIFLFIKAIKIIELIAHSEMIVTWLDSLVLGVYSDDFA